MTPRQRAILRYLWKHPRDGIEKMSAAVGCCKAVMAYHLERLNHQGYIEPGPSGTCCTRTLTPAGLLAAQGWRVLFWEPE